MSSGSRGVARGTVICIYIYISTWPGVHYTDMLLTPGDYPLFSLLFARRSRSFFRSPTLAERAYCGATRRRCRHKDPAPCNVFYMWSRAKETQSGSAAANPFFFYCVQRGTTLQYICAPRLSYIYLLFYIKYIYIYEYIIV